MTQGELEALTQKIESTFSSLELRIMSDIARRIKLNGFSTASADWQMERLAQLGRSEADVRTWLQEALNVSDAELDAIFSDQVSAQYMGHQRAYQLQGRQQIPYAENIALQQLTEAVRGQISQEYQNLAGSMGFAIRDPSGRVTYSPLMEYYRTTLDNAVMDIQSGAFSYQEVLNRTVNQMTTSGLRWIDYDSGAHNRVDVAVRRAVMTGFRQVQGRINEQVAHDLGTDSYEVTWHAGARPTHQVWQGRVYTYRQLQDICGLGEVTGLHGVNCYHDYNAFIPGVSVRTYTDEWLDAQNARENTPKSYNGKQYTTYEALQEQRKMERTMRKYRQDIELLQEGGSSEEDITLKKARYQGKMQEYRAFSRAMGLPEQKNRVYQDGLRRSVANGTVSSKTQGMKKTSKSTGLAARDGSAAGKHLPPKLLKFIDISNVSQVKSELEEHEKALVKCDVEHAIVITRTGRVYECFGDLNGVHPDADLGAELIGAFVTHNHPIGSDNEYSFSNLDLALFESYQISILRGIDERYVYELNRSSTHIDSHATINELIRSDGDMAQHENVITWAEEHGVGYTRRKSCER